MMDDDFDEPMYVDDDNESQVPSDMLVENPTFDLDLYANLYTGQGRLDRLVHIARVCPALRLEALKMAVNYVLPTSNVRMYQDLFLKLERYGVLGPTAHSDNNGVERAPAWLQNIAAQSCDLPKYDRRWMDATRQRAAMKLEKLESDLRNYKSCSIKESVRRAHNDLGDHFFSCGDLENAVKSYSRCRDYCTNAKNLLDMYQNMVKLSIYLQHWSQVHNYLEKIVSLPGFNDESNKAVVAQLKCYGGIAELQMRRYKVAAEIFSGATYDYIDLEMLSQNSIALYGGLCGLATFDRQQLQERIISSATFKPFLELETQLRDVIQAFYASKYVDCFKLLDDMRDNLMLDMYIAPHITSLYLKIRNRALIQYFTPYLAVDMKKMATDFNCTVECLENEIVPLIEEGQLLARIDAQKQILYCKKSNQRKDTYSNVMDVGAEQERRARMALMHVVVRKSGIRVEEPKRSINVAKEEPKSTTEPTISAIFQHQRAKDDPPTNNN